MVASSENSPVRYQIDDLTLDIGTRSVTRDGTDLEIRGLTFDLLVALVDSAPAIASYDYLVDRVWNGRDTSPGTIAQRAKMLRTDLSDDATAPRYFDLVRGQGYRMVAEVEEISTAAEGKQPRHWLSMAIISTLVVAGLLIAHVSTQDSPADLSVAVLPFEDLSEFGDQQHFADGLAEELIHELTTLDGLNVASRSESFYFRGPTTDLEEIGDKLNVATVVRGSIRKTGENVRIMVQVVEIESGFHLWTRTFDSHVDRIFEVQRIVADSVVGALGLKLGVGDSNDFRGAGTRSFEAYEAYLREDYVRAIELDPTYAAAWARRGMSIAATVWGDLPESAPQILEQASQHVETAVKLDPASARVQADFAAVSYERMDWDVAEQAYQKALRINRSAGILTDYGNMMMRVGRTRSAEGLYEEADELRGSTWPLKSAAAFYRSNVHVALRQVEAALHQTTEMHEEVQLFNKLTIALNFGSAEDVRAAIESLPQGTPDYSMLYATLIDLLDSPDEARAFLLELASDSSRSWPYKYESIALLVAYFGDPVAAFNVFLNELQYTTIRYGSLWFPVMSDVRQLPEFKKFLRNIELVDYWKIHGWATLCRPVDETDFICD